MKGSDIIDAPALALLMVVAGPCSGAMACPDLGGTFVCPGWQNQSPQTMIVTTTQRPDGAAVYRFRYVRDGKETTSETTASAQGIQSADGRFAFCTANAMISRARTETGEGTENFINADGNYQATNSGVTQIVCVRQKK
jgi:hypothetical protein